MKVISGSFTITAVEDGENSVNITLDPPSIIAKINKSVAYKVNVEVYDGSTKVPHDQWSIKNSSGATSWNVTDGLSAQVFVDSENGKKGLQLNYWETFDVNTIVLFYVTYNGVDYEKSVSLSTLTNGENAIRVDLDNENDTMLYDSNGNLLSGNVTSQARLYDGVEEKTNDATWIISDVSGTNDYGITDAGFVTVNGITDKVAYLQVRAEYPKDSGNYYYAQLTIKKLVNADKYELIVTPNAITVNDNDETDSHVINIDIYKTTVLGERTLVSSLPDNYHLHCRHTEYGEDVAMQINYNNGWKYSYDVDQGASSIRFYISTSADSATSLDSETVSVGYVRNGNKGDKGDKGDTGDTGDTGNTTKIFYKASYSQPSEPTSSSLNGWNETAPSLLEKVEISHGGLWIRESVGLYRSHPDMLNRHNTGIVERFYLDNKNNVDVYMPFLFSASSESADKGYIFGVKVEDEDNEYYDINSPLRDSNIAVEIGGTSQSEGLLRLPASTKSFVEVAYAKDYSTSSNGDCIHIQFGSRPIWECKAEYNPNTNTTTYGSVVKTSNFDSRVDNMPQNNIKDNLLNGTRFAEGRRDNWILSNDAFFTSGFGKANVIESTAKTSYYEFARYTLYDINGSKTLLNNTSYVFSAWTKGNNVGIYLYGKFKGEYTYTEYDSNAEEYITYTGNAEIEETAYLVNEASESGYVNNNKQFIFGYASDSNYARRVIEFTTLSDMATGSRTFEDKNIWINDLNGTRTVDLVNCKLQEVTLRFYDTPDGGYNAGLLMPKLEAGSYPTEFNVNDQDIAGLTGKLLYPAGVYDASKKYTADEYSAPYVAVKETNESGGDFSYYWLNKESAQGINPINDESNTWKKFNNFQAVYADVLVADFAKIASAVYYQKYMFSQQGVDSDGTASSNYENFLNGFTPNILLDFELGEATFRKINIGGDATFDGVVTAKALYRGITNIRPYALNNEPYYYGMEINNPVIEDFIVIADDQLWQNVPTLAPPFSGAPLYIPEPENYKGKEILIRNGLARSSDVDNKNVNIRITTPSGNATIGEGKFYDTSGGDSLGISTVSGNQYLETVRVVSDGTYWVVFEKVYIS